MWREHLQFELALLVSLLLHAAVFGGWQQRALNPIARWMAKVGANYRPVETKELPVPTITFVDIVEPATQARTFIETDAGQVTGQQPKDAQFYSDKPTVAANPDNPTGQEGDTPYLAGTQTRVMSTEDVALARPGSPSLPAPPPAAPSLPEQPKEVAEGGQKTVTQIAKADVAPEPALKLPAMAPAMPQAGSSGREVAAAKSKLTATGTFRTGVASFNVAASPFGAYDKKVVKAVQSRWYALIEQYGIYERAGVVTVHFDLYDDGTVHNMKLMENTAGEILALYCKRAIIESAPYDPLPEALRVLIGKEPREVNFTFYY
jgi:hypothetical protein